MTELRSYGPTTESTKYSEFPLQAWEPKVQLPYKTEPGCIPRKIEVERRKRSYTAQNIVALLTERGMGIWVQGLYKLRTIKKNSVESSGIPFGKFPRSS